MRNQPEPASIETSWGTIRIRFCEEGITGCALPRLSEIPADPFAILEAGADPYSIYICELFGGNKPAVPPIAALQGSTFQKAVWQGLMYICPGNTCSYKELAVRIGHARAVRAVANACGANPIPLFVPCHRVLRSDGGLGGFSSGTAWKQLLLAVEQA